MATYYVSKLGNDSNNGTSAATAFLTIDKAANEVAAGDWVYIAPGTYREMVTMDTSGGINYGTTPDGFNHIQFFGDTEAKHFQGLGITPGVIRVTQAAAYTEAAGTSNDYVWNFNGKLRVRVTNIIADGNAGSDDTSTVSRYAFRNNANQYGVMAINCTGIGSYGGFNNTSGMVRCLSVGGYINVTTVEVYDSVSIGGLYGFRGFNGVYRNCIGFGALYTYIPTGTSYMLHCMAVGGYYGFRLDTTNDIIDGCVALGCYFGIAATGVQTSARTNNCNTIACTYGYRNAYATNCFVSNCFKGQYDSNNTGPSSTAEISESPAISFSMKNMRMMQKAFIPFMTKGLMNQGVASQITGAFGSRSTMVINRGTEDDPGDPSGSVDWNFDILGRNRVNSAYGAATKPDIGPYEFSVFSGSNNPATYHATAPGINVQGRGEVVFEVAVPSGSAITASVYAKTPDADYSPRFLIRDPWTYHQYDSLERMRNSRTGAEITASSIDVGSSWADNTFQKLTAHAPIRAYDRIYELVISGSAGTNVTSSFSDFDIKVG
tara:strand:- start:1652 stop:3292 length:1641 start_codon:yes stop_codon:yes gene_type:complete